MVINIKITDKRPSVEGAPVIVCGNSDYTIKFTFDAEWDAYSTKTVRFIWVANGKVRFKDVEMKGTTECNVPKLHSTNSVRIGVYAGDLHTTTRAVIPCEWSILCEGGKPATEDYQYYANEAKDAANEAKDAATAAALAKKLAEEAQARTNNLAEDAAGTAVQVANIANFAETAASTAEAAANTARTYATSSAAAATRAEAAASTVERNGGALFSNVLKGKKSGGAVAMSDISPLEHTLDVKVSGTNVSAVKVKKLGKNLIPFPYYYTSTQTFSGIKFTINADGSVTLNGTWTGGNSSYANDFHLVRNFSLRPGKYCLSSGINSGNTYTYRLFGNITRADGTAAYVSATTEPKQFEIYEGDKIHISIRIDYQIGTVSNLTFHPQLEIGAVATEYEPYIAPIEYPVNEDGSVDDVISVYPSTTLMTDTAGAVIDVEYNRDINKAFAELYAAFISLGGNV